MKKDCRNDCLESLRFPARPDNRPALSHIGYRIGTYADIREYLLRNLDKTPGLSAWTHRGADDPGIALLEGASILGDILTFYQELYANEAYLRTAQWRESIADLVRLPGYRLSPGVGGRATFAFEIKGDVAVTIPAGFPIKAEVDGLDKPADFETSEQTIAYPWLSKFNLFCPLATPGISASKKEFYIETPDQLTASSRVELKAGDRLMVGEANSYSNPKRLNKPEIVIIDSVRELHGITIFKIKGKMKRSGSATKLAAYKLGRSFHHFGHSGPRTQVKPPKKVSSKVKVISATETEVTSELPIEQNISFFRSISGTTGSTGDGNVFSTGSAASAFLTSLSALGSVISTGITSVGSTTGLSISQAKPTVRIAEPSLDKLEYPIDAEMQDLPAGTTLVIQTQLYSSTAGGTATEFAMVRTIADIKTTSVTWGLTTGSTSMLTLNEALDTNSDGLNNMDIRQVLFHETVSPLLTIRAAMESAFPTDKNVLNFFGTAEQAQNLLERRLYLVKAGSPPLTVVVKAVDAASATDGRHPKLHKIEIDRNDLAYADFPNAAPFVYTAYGNIVDATQGKTESEAELGNGDSRLVFQNFQIPKAPLTYLVSNSETPPEVPELQIYVNNRLWKRVSSLFGKAPDDEVYIVREDTEDNSWVQFGDGKTGARLPSGVKNVVAKYRTGTGAFGAQKLNTKVQAGAKLDGFDKLQMPDVATGGSQPEDGEKAREAAPGKIQSLGRLVSLKDFESETLAMAGVTKVAAAWKLIDSIPEVVLIVLMDTGRNAELKAVQETLDGYNRSRGPNRFPVTALEGRRQYLAVSATFGYDSTYLEEDVRSAVEKALGVNSGKPGGTDDQSGLFGLRRQKFGRTEYATTIAGMIQQVEGVIWVQVKRFESLGVQDDPTIVPFPVTTEIANDTVDCLNDQKILSLFSGHLKLTAVSEIVVGGDSK